MNQWMNQWSIKGSLFEVSKLVLKGILVITCCLGEGSGDHNLKDSEKYL